MAFRASVGRSPSLWCLVLVVTILPCLGLHNGVARYRHFDDYLRNMDSEERAIITDESSPDGAGSDSDAERSITTTPPTTPSWENQRDITCCMLGQIAGDKGYHCFAKFYAARLRMRNRNRAHNRKMGFYGRNRIPDYGHRLMRTFEQCVVGDHGTIFHKCCHMVALERRDRVRYDTSASSAGRGHSTASAAEPESSASQQGESSASQHEREMNRYHHPHHRQHRTQEETGGDSVEVTTTTTESPRHQRVHRHRSSDDDASTDTANSRR
ncbi:uncharacterized protein [Dermacentor albipictus]|uniref:uncharacterized protein isoform X1 n=2 Tax=Dermacentor albipictus TaxID=60249 RepID=UPI0038FCB9ED